MKSFFEHFGAADTDTNRTTWDIAGVSTRPLTSAPVDLLALSNSFLLNSTLAGGTAANVRLAQLDQKQADLKAEVAARKLSPPPNSVPTFTDSLERIYEAGAHSLDSLSRSTQNASSALSILPGGANFKWLAIGAAALALIVIVKK